jgi:hypothetical protein
MNVALILAAFLAPAALTSCTLAFWRIAFDLRWTAGFLFPSGVFSHWQIWLGTSVLLMVCVTILDWYGKRGLRRASVFG